MTAARLARAALAVIALVACAWFALDAHQAHELSAAQAIVQSSHDVSAAQASHARSLLDAAATLNPDRSVAMARGQLELRLGDNPTAQRTFASLVRAEPENVEAWLGLSESLYGKPGLVAAVAKLALLDPEDVKKQP